jgi:hypothetical protein
MRASRSTAEHRAVPAILCDTADQKGLKRNLAVEASVTGDMHESRPRLANTWKL